MSRLVVGLIGLGPGSEPHAKSLHDLSDRIEVRMAASRGEAKAAAFHDRFGFPTTTDIDSVITDPLIQAILVLTPPSAHLDVAERCFAAGKHVLVEKPLELTINRCERLVRAGRAADRRLGVVLQHRLRPGAVRLRAILADGTLGTLAAASMAVPWWRPQAYYDEPGRGTLARDGGGVLLTQAIHTVDLFRSLVGVRSVTAAQVASTALHRMETEDYVSALVRLGNGAPGTITATTAAYPGAPERIEIIGQNGTASLIGGTLRVSLIAGGEEVLQAEGSTGSGASIMDFPHDAHRAVLADFAEAIAAGRDPAISGEEALDSQRLIAEILAKG
ncbi:Gfo/Idh/MocA family protein [Acidisphaera sp. L21]|uniref:Gfo/Idh/MocA family protein n=1 Tax=Acidisphaera sp. L21 TaxID=1641851 RepID=UPI00131DA7EE|nr:Gfo/Idh/MocA family oxidoreductase [Acidisphaera sp. L21]